MYLFSDFELEGLQLFLSSILTVNVETTDSLR